MLTQHKDRPAAPAPQQNLQPAEASRACHDTRITVTPSNSYPALCAAFRFVHDLYVEKGLITPHPSGMCFDLFQLLPYFSKTWMADVGSHLGGVATTVFHSPAGLPSSEAFADALARLRRSGRSLAEGVIAARTVGGRSLVHEVLLELLAPGVDWAQGNGADDYLVVQSRENLSFWCDKLGFDVFAEQEGENVRDRYLLRLDLRALSSGRQTFKQKLRQALAGPRASFEGGAYPLTEEEAALLLLRNSDVLSGMTSAQRTLLKHCFPNAVWVAERSALFILRTDAYPVGGPAATPAI